MSLTATIHHFAVRLSDVDRGVYETLALKVARHPSEAQQVAALDVHVACAAKHEGAEAVPFRLEEMISGGGSAPASLASIGSIGGSITDST